MSKLLSHKKILSILSLMIIFNLLVIFYWKVNCFLAQSLYANFFYCDAKEGPALSVYILLLMSSFIIFSEVLFLIIFSKKNITRLIKYIILIISIFVFLSPLVILIKGDMPITFKEFEYKKEQDKIYYEQARDDYLNSDEYKEIQKQSGEKNCQLAREAIDNWQEGEPVPLLPLGCE